MARFWGPERAPWSTIEVRSVSRLRPPPSHDTALFGRVIYNKYKWHTLILCCVFLSLITALACVPSFLFCTKLPIYRCAFAHARYDDL